MSSERSVLKSFYAVGSTVATAAVPIPAAVSGSMAADITGPTTAIGQFDQVCYQVSWTSSNAVGVISVQGSVDGINFEDLSFSTPLTQPNSDNGSYLINLALIPFPYIRPFYDRTSGTGSMVIYLSAKGS